MVYSASNYCVRPVWRSIVETESVGDGQKFDILNEHAPATGIIMSAATAIGMNLTRFEHHCWINCYVLRLFLAGKAVGHTEGIGER